MVGYSKYTVMLEEPDINVIRELATANDDTKALTKAYLESLTKTKLGELTNPEIQALYAKLVD